MVPFAHAVRPAENGDRLRMDLANDCDRQVEAVRGRRTPREKDTGERMRSEKEFDRVWLLTDDRLFER